jgi:hypothetical protein
MLYECWRVPITFLALECQAYVVILMLLQTGVLEAVLALDPIFQGLPTSLLFELASSTALTVLVSPAIYVVLCGEQTSPSN